MSIEKPGAEARFGGKFAIPALVALGSRAVTTVQFSMP